MLAQKKLIIRLLVLALVSSVVFFLAAFLHTPEEVLNIKGEPATRNEVVQALILSLLFILPSLSLILGAILAFAPYKKWPYIQKVIPGALLVLICIELGLVVNKLINLI